MNKEIKIVIKHHTWSCIYDAYIESDNNKIKYEGADDLEALLDIVKKVVIKNL